MKKDDIDVIRMQNIQTDVSPKALEKSVQDNWLGLCRTLARYTEGWSVHEDDQVMWRESLFASPDFNAVHRTSCTIEDIDSVIDRVLARRKRMGKPVAWVTWTGDTPLDLEPHLTRRGFQKQDHALPSMACDLSKLQGVKKDGSNLRIAKVETQESFLNQFVPVLMEGFGVPVDGGRLSNVWEPFVNAYVSSSFVPESTIHHWLGWEGDEPVVTGTLVYEGGVAGIYIVATRTAYRRKGYGRELTLHLMETAAANGFKIAVLRSSPMGLSVYQKLGFEVYGESTTFMVPD